MRLILTPKNYFSFFFFNDTATTEIYTLSLHDALPIFRHDHPRRQRRGARRRDEHLERSEEHTSELQSRFDLVCRLLLEKKKIQYRQLNIKQYNNQQKKQHLNQKHV